MSDLLKSCSRGGPVVVGDVLQDCLLSLLIREGEELLRDRGVLRLGLPFELDTGGLWRGNLPF